jgi:hypothetical protein
VGCVTEFGQLARVAVIGVEDRQGLAMAIQRLADLPRNFDWARAHMAHYSSQAAAQALGQTFVNYLN